MAVESEERKRAGMRPNVNNPVSVRVNDTVGSVVLGIVALALLIAFLRAEGRVRALQARLSEERVDKS